MPAKKSAKKAAKKAPAKKAVAKPVKKTTAKKAARKKAPTHPDSDRGTQVPTPDPEIIEAPPVTAAPDLSPSQASAAPSHESQIREMAYKIYCDRMSHGRPGDAVTDWLAAERHFS